MTVKISITLDETALEFIDSLGSNRSQTINQIINRAKRQDLAKRLEAAYIEQNKDPQFWAEFKLWDTTVGDGITEEDFLSDE